MSLNYAANVEVCEWFVAGVVWGVVVVELVVGVGYRVFGGLIVVAVVVLCMFVCLCRQVEDNLSITNNNNGVLNFHVIVITLGNHLWTVSIKNKHRLRYTLQSC